MEYNEQETFDGLDALVGRAEALLREKGRAVIAIDGLSMSEYTVPTLTTMVQPPARPSTPADVYKKGGQAARRTTDPAGVYEMIRGLFSCMKRMKAFCSKLRIAAGANI